MLNLICKSGATPEQLEEMLQKPGELKWYIIPLFLIVVYVLATELRAKNYNILLGAIAFWGMDLFNELWNSMVYATTGLPVWGTTAAGGSAFQILIGYNIEISFMFIILGVVACKLLRVSDDNEGLVFMDGNKNWLNDKNNLFYKANVKCKNLSINEQKIKKKAIANRIITALVGTLTAVIIEIGLNKCGVLTWDKSWWQSEVPYLIFLIGYLPFYIMAYIVHDLPRKYQFIALACIFGVNLLLIIIAGSMGMLGSQINSGWKWL